MSRLYVVLGAIVWRRIRPDACEALLGDLAEAGATETEMTTAMLGFVVRSQLQELQSWQPWLLLAGIAAPMGLMLNMVSSEIAGNDTVYLWMYAHNWTRTYLRAGWLWSELLPMLLATILSWLKVAVLAGLGGFLLARLARSTAWLQGSVLVMCLMGGSAIEHLLLPHILDPASKQAVIQSNAAVFATGFYGLVLPGALQILITVAPVLYGMRAALRTRQRAHR